MFSIIRDTSRYYYYYHHYLLVLVFSVIWDTFSYIADWGKRTRDGKEKEQRHDCVSEMPWHLPEAELQQETHHGNDCHPRPRALPRPCQPRPHHFAQPSRTCRHYYSETDGENPEKKTDVGCACRQTCTEAYGEKNRERKPNVALVSRPADNQRWEVAQDVIMNFLFCADSNFGIRSTPILPQ